VLTSLKSGHPKAKILGVVIIGVRTHGQLTAPIRSVAFNVFSNAALINFIPDYISLLVSRAIVRKMAFKPSRLKTGFWLVIDLVLTFVVSATAVFLVNCFFSVLSLRDFTALTGLAAPGYSFTLVEFAVREQWPEFLKFNFLFLHPPKRLSAYGASTLYFYSAFLTSLWVWLFALGGTSLRLLRRTTILWKRLSPYLDNACISREISLSRLAVPLLPGPLSPLCVLIRVYLFIQLICHVLPPLSE
jgi:hypothetical protein